MDRKILLLLIDNYDVGMSKLKLAITIREFDLNNPVIEEIKEKCEIIYINKTKKRLSQNELIKSAGGAECIIAGTELFSKDVLSSLTSLKIISRVGVGLDSIDLKYAGEAGIKVLNTPESPSKAVAEHTIALLMAVAKNIKEYTLNYLKEDYTSDYSYQISGKSVGIVGIGRIGNKVAEILEVMGCNILYYDPYIRVLPDKRWEKVNSVEEILKRSDILSLHAPARKGAAPLLNADSFSSCKDNLILINCARASLIEEDVLINHLKANRIAGAGLDVYSDEFIRKIHAGDEMKKLVLTPHVASNTSETRSLMETESLKNMLNHI